MADQRYTAGGSSTHRSTHRDWVQGYDAIAGCPTLIYVGDTSGWYMPTPWSEQASFDAVENGDGPESWHEPL